MNKIAIITSGNTQRAEQLYNFFKEGNRVAVDCVITDILTPESEAALEALGIPYFHFPENIWSSAPQTIIDFLRSRDISLLALDGFTSPVPAPITEAYPRTLLNIVETPQEVRVERLTLQGNETLISDSPDNATFIYPRAIVQALTAPLHRVAPPAYKGASQPDHNPTIQEEWAATLKIDYSPTKDDEATDVEKATVDVEIDETSTQEVSPEGTQPHSGNLYGKQGGNPYGKQGFSNQRLANQQYPNLGGSKPNPHYNNGQAGNGYQPMPESYLLWAILSLVFCCLIPSIVAIIFSSQVSNRYYAGDIEGSKRASRNAQIWIIISIVTGLVTSTLYLPFMLLAN